MEIERKFLFHKLPDQLDTYPHYGIEQAYVTTNPVIRVRKKTLYDAASAVSGCQYVLTVKSSGMLARQEFELPIDEAAYRTLCAKADTHFHNSTMSVMSRQEIMQFIASLSA